MHSEKPNCFLTNLLETIQFEKDHLFKTNPDFTYQET